MRGREILPCLGFVAIALAMADRSGESCSLVFGLISSGAVRSHRAQFSRRFLGLRPRVFNEDNHVELKSPGTKPDFSDLPGISEDFVGRIVAVLFATSDAPSAITVQNKTRTIAIVIYLGDDQILERMILNPGRSRSTIAEAHFFPPARGARRVDSAQDIMPPIPSVILPYDYAGDPTTGLKSPKLIATAEGTGFTFFQFDVSSDDDLWQSITGLRQSIRPLFVMFGGGSTIRRITRKSGRPGRWVVGSMRSGTKVGAVCACDGSKNEHSCNVGEYAGSILKGERHSDSPVLLPAPCQLTLDSRVAKKPGLRIPDRVLSCTDEVIE